MGASRVPGVRWDGGDRVIFPASFLIACLFAAQSAPGSDPERQPPSDTRHPASAAVAQPDTSAVQLAEGPRPLAAEFPELSVNRGDPGDRDDQENIPPLSADRWHQNLLRERQMEVRLKAARRDAESGKLVDALTELQSILDRDDDLFVRSDAEPVPRGAHILAGRIISSLSSDGLTVYENLFGPQAARLLQSATSGPDPNRLIEIIRRFYHTEAGFGAGNRLAAWWTDHGSDELAWSWWRRVLTEPAHRRRVQPIHRVQAALCAKRLGLLVLAEEIVSSAGRDQRLTIAGRPQSSGGWLAQIPETFPSSGAIVGGAILDDRIDRNGGPAGSAPALGHVLWRSPLAGEKSRHIEKLARAWERYQLQIGLPVGTSQFPVVVGRALIYRDFEALRAVELESGKPLWSYPCISSLSRQIAPQQTAPVDGNPDPQNVMRIVVGNCLLGTLSTDQRHVFAIDRLEMDEPAPGGAKGTAGDDSTLHRRPSNVILAIEIPDAVSPQATAGASGEVGAKQPKWIAGGPEDESPARHTLAGHFFLGPPLPVAERLYAVSERNQQLYLSCLKAKTGEVLWSQSICSMAQPVSADHQRFALICSPTYGEGVVVCPTQSGVLVAVDALSGKLLWAASHDDLDPQQKQQMSGWPYSARKRFGHPGYLNVPVVERSSVVYLPAHSEYVHCLDLATGRLKWRAGREDLEPSTATEYVAAVTGETVLIVGRRRCRGLDLASGGLRWSTRLGSSPSGRGVQSGNRYHLPLDDGKLISLDLESGRRCGAAPARGARLGNLIAARDVIVSFGLDCVAVYPQAQELAEQMEDKQAVPSAGPARLLDAAELELTLGRFDRAAARLADVMEVASGTAEAVRAESLFSELGRLASDQRAAEEVLERIAAASDSGRHAACLFERSRRELQRGEPADSLAAARELAGLDSCALSPCANDPSRLAAADVAAAELFHEIVSEGAARPAFERQIAADLTQAFETGDVEAIRRSIRLCGGSPCAERARLRLAEMLADQGRVQQAETVLLACRESPHPACAAHATRRLAELWEARGLDHEAGLLLAELATRFSSAEVAAAQTGAQWIAALPRDSRSLIAWRKLSPPVWSGSGLKIVEQRVADERLQSIYNGNGVQYLPTPRHLPFDLFDQGRGGAMLLSVVDRERGTEYPEVVHLPGRSFYPVSMQPGYMQHSLVGNLLPLGGTGALHGVSLLERRVLWTSVPRELEGTKDVVRVGPSGPGFCVFQNRHRLFAVDPFDGRVLWQRNDIEPAAGLMGSDPALGIIGDERVLVVFASNGANYTVYDTASGAELRRGKLDIQTRMLRRAMGRRLFHYTAAAETQRVRVWDALSNSMVWDDPAGELVEASVFEGVSPGTKVAQFVREAEELAFVTVSGRIRVVDLVEGRQRFEFAIDRRLLENLSALRAFRDRDRYYFSLQHAAPPGLAVAPSGNFIADASIPCVHVQGSLCAYDLRTREMLWQRSLGNRSLLHLPHFPLPVLVSLCRVRKQDQSFLDVEVLDVATGETLAHRDDLFSDRLLQVSYDRQAGLVALRGAKTVIRLEFPAEAAHLSAGEPPR
jgi:outer membrane protein assembly factor BamB